LDPVGVEPVGVFPRLPYVDDPEHVVRVVEPGGVDDQALERALAETLLDVVVVCGRPVGDRELLDEDDCHRNLLWRDGSILSLVCDDEPR
jgi:hypothetical protein